VRVSLPGAGANAATGVVIMARATIESIKRSAAWVGQQSACKAR
jgi:hypothetical protein